MRTFVRGAAGRPRLLARVLLLAGVAAGLSVPALRPAEAGDVPTKRFRDQNAKFSFKLFPDWDPVPLETEGKSARQFGSSGTDKYAVCQYFQRGADKRGQMAGKLLAYRMGGGATGIKTGTTTEEDGAKKDPFLEKLRSAMGDDDPKTMRDLFKKALDGYGFLDEPPKPGAPQRDWKAMEKEKDALADKILDLKLAKPIKSRDAEPVPGLMWAIERKNPQLSWTDKPCYLVMATWKKDDMEVGLWMTCAGEQKKTFEQGFKMVSTSFLWFDEKAEDAASLDVLNGLPISAAKRRDIERGLVKGWDVVVSPKKNYIILYNTVGKRNDLLARILGERIEQIREQVYEHQFPPAAKIEAVCIARICGDRAEYHHYGGPGGSAGYWNSDTEELVFYDASPKKEPDDDTLAVLYHEAFHQYIYYSVGEVAPHSWFNEGHGDYYAGSKYLSKKFAIRPFNWRVGVIKEALVKGPCKPEAEDPKKPSTDGPGGSMPGGDDEGGPSKRVNWDRSKGGYTPLEYFVKMTQGEYYSYPSVSYAQGWSLVYFLREFVPKNPKWNEKWGKILGTYFDTLKAEANKDKPLTPKKAPKPEDPGMGGDAPGMGDTTPPEPPPTDDPTPPAAPPGGPTAPGMDGGEPGMGTDDPGMGGDAPGGDGEDPTGGFIMPPSRFRGSGEALKKAVEEAFKGVDFAELETAWRDTMKKIGAGK